VTVKKYRPYYTAKQIQLINSKMNPEIFEELNILRANRLFQLKIETGFASPAIELVVKPTIEQKLGFEPSPPLLEEYRKAAADKYKIDPTSLTDKEMEDRKAYIFTYGTEEEKAEIEKQLLTDIGVIK